MIPKKIHYCWFGGTEIPAEYQRYLDSWRRHCPDYEIIRWDEGNFDVNAYPYAKQAYEAKKWSFVSDIARLCAVLQYGGIYLDTDVEVVRSLDPLLDASAFFAFQDPESINTGLGFGAEPNHPIVRALLEYYSHVTFYQSGGRLDMTPCPVHNSRVLEKFGARLDGTGQQIAGNVQIYPVEAFSPIDYETGRMTSLGPENYAIHHYKGSWKAPEEKKMEQRYRWAVRCLGKKAGRSAAAVLNLPLRVRLFYRRYGFRGMKNLIIPQKAASGAEEEKP